MPHDSVLNDFYIKNLSSIKVLRAKVACPKAYFKIKKVYTLINNIMKKLVLKDDYDLMCEFIDCAKEIITDSELTNTQTVPGAIELQNF